MKASKDGKFYASKTKVSLCPGKAYVLVLNGLAPNNASEGTLHETERDLTRVQAEN